MSAWTILPAPQGVVKVRRNPLRGQRYGHCYDTYAGDRFRAARVLSFECRRAIAAAGRVRIVYLEQ